ncbi:MAG: hypothetical protein WA581_07025 [Candidatus Acidiferrales bacterium]
MKYRSYAAIVVLASVMAGCRGKKDETEVVPPGFYATQGECQPDADRQNAHQEQLRQKLTSQGVHEQYLPCGTYGVTKAPNGYWSVTRDTAGCPSTASQQDPHPDPSKAKRSH